MADSALVGLPSVGKSSLIARMSAARPKIADYPFTTLVPNLGMVRSGNLSFVVADVPGLIAGAAEGKGLGHQFLRHIERTALIQHVLDGSGGFEQRDIIQDYQTIRRELELYDEELSKRPCMVLVNKMDMPGASERLQQITEFLTQEALAAVGGNEFSQDFEKPLVFAVSAVTGEGIPQMIAATAERVHLLRAEAREVMDALQAQQAEFEKIWRHQNKRHDEEFSIQNMGGGVFCVVGKLVERMVIQTEWENPEALDYLQRRLDKLGVEKALVKAGALPGDEIRISNRAFAFESLYSMSEQDAEEDNDA